MPEKQAPALIAIESLGQRTSYLERTLDTAPSLKAYRRANNGEHWGYNRLLGGVPGESAGFEPSPASPSTPFHGSEMVRAAVKGSEANVCFRLKKSRGF